MFVPKYVMILLVYSTINFYPHSDNMVVHRKSSASGPPKPADIQVTAPKTAAPMAVATASSSVGGTGWTILSTADAWDCSRRVTEFLEGLKIEKPIRKISPLFLLLPQSPDILH
jgi:hypothetical protein